MKDFVKTLDDLPRIVKFILVLIGDLFANVYRLCRSIAKNNVLGNYTCGIITFNRWIFNSLDY